MISYCSKDKKHSDTGSYTLLYHTDKPPSIQNYCFICGGRPAKKVGHTDKKITVYLGFHCSYKKYKFETQKFYRRGGGCDQRLSLKNECIN